VTDQELAAELRVLSKHPRLKPRAEQLRELAWAVLTPGDAERWCEVDLFAAFPPGESVRSISSGSGIWHRALKFVDVVQPVLVFLPIVTTWFGLKMATTAYGETLAAAGVEAARRPFLEMWQQGFDGRLPGWLRFDSVAFMTLGVIGVLIVVTLVERLLRRSIEQEAEEEAVALRSRLLAALTRATLHLGQVKLASPARFQAELTKSASELNKVGRTMSKVHTQVVEELEKALEATGQATDALTVGVAEVRDSIASLDKHMAAVSSAAETLLRSVERTAYAIDSVGEKTDVAVDRVGDRLGTVILDSTTGVRKSLDELATLTGQAVRDMTASTGEVVRNLASSTGQAVRDLADSTGQAVRDTAASLDARVGELVSATTGIGSAVGRVETAATESGDRISHALTSGSGTLSAVLGGAGADIREALDDWAGTASAHAARIEMVSDTAGRTVRLLEETRDALDRLPADLARSLQEVPAAVREVTGPEIAALQAAVARLDEAVRQAAAAVTAGLTTGAAKSSGADTAAVPAHTPVPAGPMTDPHSPAPLNTGDTSGNAENSGERAEGWHP
jgi:ABC-type transporter Mla subunit MlaD